MQNMVGNSIQKQMAGGTKEPGEKVYLQRQSSLCHILNETGAPIASDLTGIGSRREAGWLAVWFFKGSSGRRTKINGAKAGAF